MTNNKTGTNNEALAIKSDIASFRNDLIKALQKTKNETIAWIVGMGILQILANFLAEKFL